MQARDYYHATAGTAHHDNVSPHGCTALITLTAGSWKNGGP